MVEHHGVMVSLETTGASRSDDPPRAGDRCGTSQCGSMGINPQQEGKAITLYN
jgi:hypothetical protein